MLLMLLDSIGQTLLSFVRDHRRLQNVSLWDRCCLLDLVKITGQFMGNKFKEQKYRCLAINKRVILSCLIIRINSLNNHARL